MCASTIFSISKYENEENDLVSNFIFTISKPNKTTISQYIKEQLDISLSFLNYQHGKMIDNTDITSILSQSKIDKITLEYETNQSKLKNDILDLNRKIADLTRDKTNLVEEYENKLQQVRREISSINNEELLTYKNKVETLKDDLFNKDQHYIDKINDLVVKNHNLTSQISMKELELENTILKMNSDFKEQLSVIEEKHSKVLNTSSLKGKESEFHLKEYLISKFPSSKGYEVFHISQIEQLCDIILTDGNSRAVLIEDKAYSSNVPTREVDKFVRDMKDPNLTGFNSIYGNKIDTVIGGIFLSRDSAICNKNLIDFEMIDDRVVFYLSNYSQTYELIPLLYDIIKKYYENAQSISFWDKLDNIETIKKIINDMNEDKKLFTKLMLSMNENIGMVNDLKGRMLSYSNRLRMMFNSDNNMVITTTVSLKEQVMSLFNIELDKQFEEKYGYVDIDISRYISSTVVKGVTKYVYSFENGKVQSMKYNEENRVNKLQTLIVKMVSYFNV